jgi:oxygen-independent coproporphyrinogen III oxidase
LTALYLHIPFCKQACYYCDFHFSTNLQAKTQLVNAICQEIALQKDYLGTNLLQTIYLGGGTPSLLNEKELNQIFETIYQYFSVEKNAEITLEANPDDLNPENLKIFKNTGINRLSIGIQSFDENHLNYLHRAHTAAHAHNCVKLAQDLDFQNLTIDLIYAIPAANHQIWEHDLQTAIQLNIPHISAYCLTIESKTVFGNWLKNQKIKPIDEEFAAQQFEILLNTLKINDFEQYEISNFARHQQYSQHNSNYWKKGNYLGIGPSAHSYNGFSRQFNVANNAKYWQSIDNQTIPAEVELLTPINQANEYLMTGLRTKWGVDLQKIKVEYGFDLMDLQKKYLDKYLKINYLQIENNHLYLTESGKLLADEITADLFLVD